jgi:hypothetical protein
MRKVKLEESKEKKKELSKQERLAEEQLKNLEGIMPEIPRFEGFFNSLSKGKHPFEEEDFARGP